MSTFSERWEAPFRDEAPPCDLEPDHPGPCKVAGVVTPYDWPEGARDRFTDA